MTQINATVTPALRTELSAAARQLIGPQLRAPQHWAHHGQALPGSVFYAHFQGRDYAMATVYSWATGADDEPFFMTRRTGSTRWSVTPVGDATPAQLHLPSAVLQAWGGAHSGGADPWAGLRSHRTERELSRLDSIKLRRGHSPDAHALRGNQGMNALVRRAYSANA